MRLVVPTSCFFPSAFDLPSCLAFLLLPQEGNKHPSIFCSLYNCLIAFKAAAFFADFWLLWMSPGTTRLLEALGGR